MQKFLYICIVKYIYMKTYIYTLTDPRDNLVKYVGKTISPKRRQYEYSGKYYLSKRKNKATTWIKKLHSLEIKPIFEIIDEIEGENWQWLEQYWISQFKTWGFNLKNQTIGGEGVVGWNWSNDRRIRQAEIMREVFLKNNPTKGKDLTNHNSNFAKKILMLDPITDEVLEEFSCIKYAVEKYNYKHANISMCLTKRYKKAYGYKWKYKYEKK